MHPEQSTQNLSVTMSVRENDSSASERPVVSSATEAESKGPADIEDYVAEMVMKTLGRLKAAAYQEVKSLSLPDSTTQDVMRALQRSLDNEYIRTSTDPQSKDLGPVYTLHFNHDCMALGCTQSTCDLCECNPKRGCISDFDKKYFKGDMIKAKCGGLIYVEMLDPQGEIVPVERMAPNAAIEVSVIDGNKYEQLIAQDALGPEMQQRLESCTLIFGNEGRPLLHSEEKSHNRENGRVVIPIQGPKTSVSDLSVHCSSEALLSGRRPPFRLMACFCSSSQTHKPMVTPAVSTNFIVASGRSRLSQKKIIPFSDDPVSRLENMGKERIKKLSNLRVTADDMNVEFLPSAFYQVKTVADFKRLAFEADNDGQLKQKILHMLKMSEKAWEESKEHAACAISNDTRMRAWYRQDLTDLQGIACTCYLGETDIERPVALLIKGSIILKECLDANQRKLMKDLQTMAKESWWKPNHPGWTFFHFDSEEYKKDHTSLLSIGEVRYEHHSRQWPIPTQPEGDTRKQIHHRKNDRGASQGSAKRTKKPRTSKGSVPPMAPKKSLCEMGSLVTDPQFTVSNTRHQMTIFEAKDGTHTMLPSGAGPVIPRNPPDSAFTRGGNPNNETLRGEAIALPYQQKNPDSSLLEQFYITSPGHNNKVPTTSGLNLYSPLKTPFDARPIEELLKRQMTQLQYKPDEAEDVTGANVSLGRPAIPENPFSLFRPPADARMAACRSEQFTVSMAPNRLSCSIESLPSQCKAAIYDQEHIRQMENRNGLSKQDLHESFEGCVLGQMRRHAAQSHCQQPEGTMYMVPLQGSAPQMQDSVQQMNMTPPGLFSYGIVLVPVANDQQQDPKQTNMPSISTCP